MDRQKMGAKLKSLRGDLPMETVAKAVGVTVVSISLYERGRRVPRDDVKVKLSRFYGKSIEYIFFD